MPSSRTSRARTPRSGTTWAATTSRWATWPAPTRRSGGRPRSRRKVQGHPAAQRAARVRASLDSMRRGLTNDSTVLARLVTSSQSRKAREAKLAPADQQLFTRDSTARAQAVARQRAALAAALQQLAADSSALTNAFAPAIDALKEFLAAYPGEIDAAVTLATLSAQSGHPAQP